jgi:hypothetical protein
VVKCSIKRRLPLRKKRRKKLSVVHSSNSSSNRMADSVQIGRVVAVVVMIINVVVLSTSKEVRVVPVPAVVVAIADSVRVAVYVVTVDPVAETSREDVVRKDLHVMTAVAIPAAVKENSRNSAMSVLR